MRMTGPGESRGVRAQDPGSASIGGNHEPSEPALPTHPRIYLSRHDGGKGDSGYMKLALHGDSAVGCVPMGSPIRGPLEPGDIASSQEDSGPGGIDRHDVLE